MIITVDHAQPFHDRVAEALAGTRWATLLTSARSVTDAIELLRSTPQVQAVIGGPNLSLDHGLLLAEHAVSSKSGAVVLLVADPTTEILRRAMRAGARDVLAPEFDAAELTAALADAGVASGGPVALPGLTMAVLGVKGGVGSSVVASNLAIRLADAAKQPVTLCDLDLASADLAVMHGVTARWTIQDVADGTMALDIESLREVLQPLGDSGARLLPGPVDPALAERITATDVGGLIALLRSESPLVVLDLATSFDDRTLTALDATDLLVLTAGLDVASLRGLAVALRTLERLEFDESRVRVVLVRADSKAGLTVNDVERTIGRPVDVKVPSTRAVPRSVNEGVPLAQSSTRSGVVQAIDELVSDVLFLLPDSIAAHEAGDNDGSALKRLLGRNRDDGASADQDQRPERSVGSAPVRPAPPAPVRSEHPPPQAASDTASEPDEAADPSESRIGRPRVVRRRRVVGDRVEIDDEDDGEVLFLGDPPLATAEEPLAPAVPIDRARRTPDGRTSDRDQLAELPPPVVPSDDRHDDGDRPGGRHFRRS